MARYCRGCEHSDGMPHRHLSAREEKARAKLWKVLVADSRRREKALLKKLGLKKTPDLGHPKYKEYHHEWTRPGGYGGF